MKRAAAHGPAFTTFDLPDGSVPNPTSINATGVIAGYGVDTNNVNHGFCRKTDGTIEWFDAPGASTTPGEGTIATAINPSRHIAGFFYGGKSGHGFVRDRAGAFVVFDIPASRGALARTINPAGVIAGFYYAAGVGQAHGFVRGPGGMITTFDVAGATDTYALALNDSGTIAGTYSTEPTHKHAFVRQANGSIVTFDVPNAIDTSLESPAAINAAGQIAGHYFTAANPNRRGYVHSQNGQITTFDVPNAVQTSPVGINNGGDIVGNWSDAAGKTHGFLRLANGNIITLDVPNSWNTWPIAINQAGTITGYYQDMTSKVHGFVYG